MHVYVQNEWFQKNTYIAEKHINISSEVIVPS